MFRMFIALCVSLCAFACDATPVRIADAGPLVVVVAESATSAKFQEPAAPIVHPKPDPRTAAQIAQAACTARDGSWACATRRPTALATTSGAPIIPPSWTVPSWWIDPANSTGCAADSNSCTSSTCGTTGIGPCLTWHEINDHRWGCQGSATTCPRIRQGTTITFLSSQADDTDPVYLVFGLENQAILTLAGALGTGQQVATGTFSGTVAKNRATNQLQTETLAAGLVAGQLLNNTTHSAMTWVYHNTSGTTWNLSQPLTPFSIPGSAISTTEVTTFVDGDAYTVYAPVNVNIVAVLPTIESHIFSSSLSVYISHVNIWDPFGNHSDPTVLGQGVLVTESSSNRSIAQIGSTDSTHAAGATNSYLASAQQTFASVGPQQSAIVYGGVLSGTDLESDGPSGVRSVVYDGDVIVDELVSHLSNVQVSSMYVATTRTVELFGTNQLLPAVVGPFLWGPGAATLRGSARFTYPSGAAQAAASLLITTISENSATVGCLGVPNAASAYASCNLSITAAQLDTSLGATSGCIGTPNGAGFCNYGP